MPGIFESRIMPQYMGPSADTVLREGVQAAQDNRLFKQKQLEDAGQGDLPDGTDLSQFTGASPSSSPGMPTKGGAAPAAPAASAAAPSAPAGPISQGAPDLDQGTGYAADMQQPSGGTPGMPTRGSVGSPPALAGPSGPNAPTPDSGLADMFAQNAQAAPPQIGPKPRPGEILTDQNQLSALNKTPPGVPNTPRFATTTDADHHDQLSQLLAATGGTDNQTMQDRTGMPPIIRLPHGIGSVATGMTPTGRALESAELRAQVMGELLRGRIAGNLMNTDERGGQSRLTVDRRSDDQLGNFMAEMGPKDQEWLARNGVRYEETLGQLATRHGYRSDEINQIIAGHRATAEILMKMKGSDPRLLPPNARQAAISGVFRNMLPAGNGDPQATLDAFHTSPQWGDIQRLGVTDDMIVGQVNQANNKQANTDVGTAARVAGPYATGADLNTAVGSVKSAKSAAGGRTLRSTAAPDPLKFDSRDEYIAAKTAWNKTQQGQAPAASKAP